jgi:hypothetical protein
MDDLPQQSRPQRVDLRARVAQPGHLDDGRRADPQPGAAGQGQQIDVPGRDVLAELAGADVEALIEQLVEQLGLQGGGPGGGWAGRDRRPPVSGAARSPRHERHRRRPGPPAT